MTVIAVYVCSCGNAVAEHTVQRERQAKNYALGGVRCPDVAVHGFEPEMRREVFDLEDSLTRSQKVEGCEIVQYRSDRDGAAVVEISVPGHLRVIVGEQAVFDAATEAS